ncbi:MAG: hypothetical protein AABY22_29005 [Nanoarchaeota archaeon]
MKIIDKINLVLSQPKIQLRLGKFNKWKVLIKNNKNNKFGIDIIGQKDYRFWRLYKLQKFDEWNVRSTKETIPLTTIEEEYEKIAKSS